MRWRSCRTIAAASRPTSCWRDSTRRSRRAAATRASSAGPIALDELAKWDRVVDSRPIVSYYQAFEDAVWRRTFIDEMDEELFFKFYEWAGAEKPAGLYALLDDPQSKWWDDITTVEITETRDEIFLTGGAGRRAVSAGRVGR